MDPNYYVRGIDSWDNHESWNNNYNTNKIPVYLNPNINNNSVESKLNNQDNLRIDSLQGPLVYNDTKIKDETKIGMSNDKTNVYSEYNYAYSNNPFLDNRTSDYVEVSHYLAIDSRDRDRVKHPSPNSYTVNLEPAEGFTDAHTQKSFNNIKSIELISCIVPSTNSVTNEQYLLLEIPELDYYNYVSTNTNTDKSVFKLVFNNLPGPYISIDRDLSEPLILEYKQAPLSTLRKLSINFKTYSGTLFNWGADNALPDPPNQLLNNCMTFKITTLEHNTQKLNTHTI